MKSAKKWLTVTVTCPEKLTEAVADQMGVMSGVGVEIRPLPSSDKQAITGFFALDGTAGSIEQEAAETLTATTRELEKLFAIYNLILHEPVTAIIDDQDWATSWQKFFSPVEIIPGLVIRPSWEEYAPDANQYVITMDPGMAFGTGQHASTRLALMLIASCFDTDHNRKPRRVLDIGTGTGILAMAAAAYGADQIMAIDNDPEAVTVAEHNVLVNHFDWNIGVSTRPLKELEGPYDLICANIVHDVLIDMAPRIKRLAENNSHIILSGILNGEQEKNIEEVFQENSMRLIRTEHQEEWAALLLQRET
ncbi:MAG TPA: 50S ribosomal protein L11 methyltransferase [Desulfobacteraceae bacterium]|nr:50S ribosomal protein L11 methyltransferase [Desulfobacteraceae bacterium]